MQTLLIGEGYTKSWTVTLRDDLGVAITSYYAGTESLDLVVADSTNTAATFGSSLVEWLSGTDGTVTLTVHEDDTTSNAGRYKLSIGVTKNGYRVEGYTSVLIIEPRA